MKNTDGEELDPYEYVTICKPRDEAEAEDDDEEESVSKSASEEGKCGGEGCMCHKVGWNPSQKEQRLRKDWEKSEWFLTLPDVHVLIGGLNRWLCRSRKTIPSGRGLLLAKARPSCSTSVYGLITVIRMPLVS